MYLLMLLFSCNPAPECPPQPPETRVLTEAEATLLSPYLDELRKGVTRFGEQGFGVCQGKRACDAFLGAEPPDLAPGDYLIKAELAVPRIGDGWKVEFHIDCQLTTADGRTTTQTHDRAYDVRAVKFDMGYRLQPLWMIQSPHPNGARACTFSLTPVRPDGTKGEAWAGKYSTPAPDPNAPPPAPAALPAPGPAPKAAPAPAKGR